MSINLYATQRKAKSHLKPCPFCNKQPKVTYWRHNNKIFQVVIDCDQDGHKISVSGLTYKKVAQEWNNGLSNQASKADS